MARIYCYNYNCIFNSPLEKGIVPSRGMGKRYTPLFDGDECRGKCDILTKVTIGEEYHCSDFTEEPAFVDEFSNNPELYCENDRCLYNKGQGECLLEEIVIISPSRRCNSRGNKSSHWSSDPAKTVQGGSIPDTDYWV
jgi:hypothetical protein